MSNIITGTLYKVLPKQSGAGAKGTWVKAEFIIETKDQYPKKIKVAVMKTDLIEKFEKMNPGDTVEVHYNIESREWNDKWFTEVTAWKIDLKESGNYKPEPINSKADESDDLPF